MLCHCWDRKQNASEEQSSVACVCRGDIASDASLCMVGDRNKNASLLFAQRARTESKYIIFPSVTRH